MMFQVLEEQIWLKYRTTNRSIFMGQGYQDRDFEIIDYELYKLVNFKRPFRGPKPKDLSIGQYFTAIGAAQTFGCYCPVPYPTYLQHALDLPVLNFGVAGAGPAFFVEQKNYLNRINQSRFAIIQVMSGRSESNSLFISKGGEMLTRRSDGVVKGAAPMYAELIRTSSADRVLDVVNETRDNWLNHMRLLLNRITVPKVLLWMSTRAPEYELSLKHVNSLFGEFPHMITGTMLTELKPLCDHYVESVCSDGLPQRLYNRLTGEPVSIQMRSDLGGKEKHFNDYYPSPEMQLHAAQALLPVCQKLSNSNKKTA